MKKILVAGSILAFSAAVSATQLGTLSVASKLNEPMLGHLNILDVPDDPSKVQVGFASKVVYKSLGKPYAEELKDMSMEVESRSPYKVRIVSKTPVKTASFPLILILDSDGHKAAKLYNLKFAERGAVQAGSADKAQPARAAVQASAKPEQKQALSVVPSASSQQAAEPAKKASVPSAAQAPVQKSAPKTAAKSKTAGQKSAAASQKAGQKGAAASSSGVFIKSRSKKTTVVSVKPGTTFWSTVKDYRNRYRGATVHQLVLQSLRDNPQCFEGGMTSGVKYGCKIKLPKAITVTHEEAAFYVLDNPELDATIPMSQARKAPEKKPEPQAKAPEKKPEPQAKAPEKKPAAVSQPQADKAAQAPAPEKAAAGKMPEQQKPAESRPAQANPAEEKSAEEKRAEIKRAAEKLSETKPAEEKPQEQKPQPQKEAAHKSVLQMQESGQKNWLWALLLAAVAAIGIGFGFARRRKRPEETNDGEAPVTFLEPTLTTKEQLNQVSQMLDNRLQADEAAKRGFPLQSAAVAAGAAAASAAQPLTQQAAEAAPAAQDAQAEQPVVQPAPEGNPQAAASVSAGAMAAQPAPAAAFPTAPAGMVKVEPVERQREKLEKARTYMAVGAVGQAQQLLEELVKTSTGKVQQDASELMLLLEQKK